MHGVVDADVQRTRFAGHDDRRAAERALGPYERHDGAAGDGDDGQHAARDQ